MHQAIIFDLGNVIIRIAPGQVFEYWAKVSGIPASIIRQKFSLEDERRMERGEISPAIFRKLVCNRIGYQFTDGEFDDGWNRMLVDLVPDMEAVILDLKKHYRLAGLSNTNPIHLLKFGPDYAGVLGCFDKFFFSHEIGVRKPEPEAFARVLDYLELRPEQTVFIDDQPDNVNAAVKLGITGIVMSSAVQLRNELKLLGLLI